MSFFKKLLGLEKKEKDLMEQPEQELAPAPPDDLMVVSAKGGSASGGKDEGQPPADTNQAPASSAEAEQTGEEASSNKDSPL